MRLSSQRDPAAQAGVTVAFLDLSTQRGSHQCALSGSGLCPADLFDKRCGQRLKCLSVELDGRRLTAITTRRGVLELVLRLGHINRRQLNADLVPELLAVVLKDEGRRVNPRGHLRLALLDVSD